MLAAEVKYGPASDQSRSTPDLFLVGDPQKAVLPAWVWVGWRE
jgi:hypothetical protein